MNTVVSLWIAAPVLGKAVILQWTVLRMKYRNELTKQLARCEQQQQATSRDIEQGEAADRATATRLGCCHASSQAALGGRAAPTQSDSRMKEALNRMLDDADASRRHPPTNGFVDTQPSPHSPHDIGLLFR
jgi:hypothetical protein